MSSTTIEKILARASGKDEVRPGDIVICRPDMVMFHEMQFATDGYWYRPKKIFDASRVALIFDHAVPAPTIKDAAGQQIARKFVQQFGIKNFFDVGAHGISHVIAAEHGLARPGELFVCPDSHTCASGAFNAAARGIGPLDTIQALTHGSVWYPVSPTIRYEFSGRLPPNVSGKDVFFHIANVYGGHSGYSVEFGGPQLSSLKMADRRTIAAMCAELSSEFSIFDYDEVTENYLRDRMDSPPTPANPDPGAQYEDVRNIDLATLEPYVVRPDYVQRNGVRISDFSEEIKIDQAFVGSCANGQIEDIRVAARILKGRKIARGVRMIVTPGSQSVAIQAVKEGLVEAILEAGAVFTNSTCGACYGGHMGLLAPGEVCITASTRNFKGRMGSMDAKIYMGSPATVAASAIAGHIVDPRILLDGSDG